MTRGRQCRTWRGAAPILLAVCVLVGCNPRPNVDPLCDYVKAQGLQCPALLGSPSIFRPGSITKEDTVTRQGDAEAKRVTIPTSQLDSSSCLVPGTSLVPPSPEPQREFPLQTFSYELSTGLKVGAKFPIPQLQGLEIAAGPEFKKIKKIDISGGSATLLLLDENRLTSLISDCRIRPSCVQGIRDLGDRVVNAILVAGDLSYSFSDMNNAAIDLNAVIGGKMITLSGNLSNFLQTRTGLTSRTPIVIGLTLVRQEVISRAIPCKSLVVYIREGSSTVSIGGGGGSGNLARVYRVSAANSRYIL